MVIVGILSDNLNFEKNQLLIINEKLKIIIIQNIKCIDIVFIEKKLEYKKIY
jgi:hypothetical protein